MHDFGRRLQIESIDPSYMVGLLYPQTGDQDGSEDA